MKHPNSGLYHYCLNLGTSIQKLLANDRTAAMSFYVPPQEVNSFGASAYCIVEKKRIWNFFRSPVKSCDIWHAPFQSGRVLPDKKRNPATKVVLTIHDLNALHEGKPMEEQRESLAHTQSLIDKSDAIVCISEFCKSDVLNNCDVHNKAVHVVHNGTHKVHPPALNGHSYRPSRPFLFGMGYVNAKKNFHVLVPLLQNEGMELLVAGHLDDPAYIERIKNDAASLGVADRLHLLGPVSEGEKGWYLQHCLAYVHPSLAEGFGAPVVEAMQFGKPLFLAALTSLPEIGGDAAFYFSSFDKEHMQKIFYDGMIRYDKEAMEHTIRKRGKQFDWNEKAKEYLSIYQSLY
jgi:glycosyltransferase involved in cell wall biosynthesis